MSLSGQAAVVASRGLPRGALAPSPSRVQELDATLRGRLAKSLDYIGELAQGEIDGDSLADLQARLVSAPVSPWVFCLYSKLVAELSRDAGGDIGGIFEDVVLAASLPADAGVVAFADPAVSASWWDHFRILLDTDRQRPFRPAPPSSTDFRACASDVGSGLALLRRADVELHNEVRSLLRVIVLGAPVSAEPKDGFNGASTFFLWGAALLNASIKRDAIAMVDLLVHESSHVLLFGLAAEGGLTRNTGNERFASPLRSDKRPIEGIFHGSFVTTRVHAAMRRLLDSGRLSADEAAKAIEAAQRNGRAARASLELLAQHAEPTELGEKILDTLDAYWAGVAA
jgi:hypothetical protein